MAAVNGYTDLITLKTRLDIVDTSVDTILENVIEAASRAIDGFTNRHFFQAAGVTRHYTGEFGDLLFVDDLVNVTTLTTDEDGDRTYETAWATTDFDLEPFNAADDNRPFTKIRTTPNGVRAFPRIRRGVEIVGDWGWPAVPDAITEATLIQAFRLYKRKDAPFGVAGNAELGQLQVLRMLDPDVKGLIAPYRRMVAGAI